MKNAPAIKTGTISRGTTLIEHAAMQHTPLCAGYRTASVPSFCRQAVSDREAPGRNSRSLAHRLAPTADSLQLPWANATDSLQRRDDGIVICHTLQYDRPLCQLHVLSGQCQASVGSHL